MSKNRIKYFESDSVLEEFYNALANQDEKKLRRVQGHSWEVKIPAEAEQEWHIRRNWRRTSSRGIEAHKKGHCSWHRPLEPRKA